MKNDQSNKSLPQVLTDNFQKMANISMEAFQPVVETFSENMAHFNKTFSESGLPTLNLLGGASSSPKKGNCCPPEHACPPHCIAYISRQAMAGERVLVPFSITNSCQSQKKYRVGVRELKDLDGNMAPAQPELNKMELTLDPGRSERVILSLDLGQFKNGNSYETEIVVREREINQNICFALNVNDHPSTEVAPYDEKKYKLKWQDWQSHFYCEPREKRGDNVFVKPLKPS